MAAPKASHHDNVVAGAGPESAVPAAATVVMKEHSSNGTEEARKRFPSSKDSSVAISISQAPPASVAAEAADTENLMPLENPAFTLEKVQNALLSSAEPEGDWKVAAALIKDVQCLCLHHAVLLNNASSKPNHLFGFLLKQASSPRSALARCAFAALENVFRLCPNALLTYTDEVDSSLDSILQLLTLKSVNEKKFIADGAKEALEAMSFARPSFAFVNDLILSLTTIAATSKNIKLTAVTMRVVHSSLENLSIAERRSLTGVEQIVSNIIEIESGKSTESRPVAQQAILMLHSALGHNISGENERLRDRIEAISLKSRGSVSESTPNVTKPWLAKKTNNNNIRLVDQ